MQGIADLAQVKRPVVSTWRQRYAAGASAVADPFPEPERRDPLEFDAAKVAAWLAATGRGNNPEAGLESPLYSSALQALTSDLERATALLVLQHVTGEQVSGVDFSAAAAHLNAFSSGLPIAPAVLDSALVDLALCSAVDQLSEAAFSGGRVLDRLVDGFTAAAGPWATEALTAPAMALLGQAVAEVVRLSPRSIVPLDVGGLIVAGCLTEHLGEQERLPLRQRGTHPADHPLESSYSLAAWARLAAHGFPVELEAPGAPAAPRGSVYLTLSQEPEPTGPFIDQVSDVLHSMGGDDVLLVVGPAWLLTEPAGRRQRTRLLAPAKAPAAPLRYVARLPKGLSKFGGRRQLAIWVFNPDSSERTVVGSHSNTRLNAAARSAIAGDVAASLAGARAVRAHAFHSSVVLQTEQLVRQEQLVTGTLAATVAITGGERLARVWKLRDAIQELRPEADPLDGVDLEAAGTPVSRSLSLEEATRDHLALDLPGTRIAEELLQTPEAGSAVVIGADEVRVPEAIGQRAVDRLVLEQAAPRARLTQPGDVIYLGTGEPAAIVDEDGGHVTLAPARILRCSGPRGGRQLVPEVVADDICQQLGVDRRAWRLRTIPTEQADVLQTLSRPIAVHRRRAMDELQALDALRRELIDGLAEGALAASTESAPQVPPVQHPSSLTTAKSAKAAR